MTTAILSVLAGVLSLANLLLRTRHEAKAEKVRALTAEVAGLRGQIEDERKRHEAQTQLIRAENLRLVGQIDDLKKQVADVGVLRTENLRLTRLCDEQEAKISALEVENRRQAGEMLELHKEIDQLRRELEELLRGKDPS